MSQSPTSAGTESQPAYLEAFNQLAMKIRDGQSFSGRERNCFFLNTGGLRFADASAAAGLDLPDDARGMVMTDWDGDGDLDVLLTNRNAPRVRFLRNDCASGHWLGIRLTGLPAKRTPRDAIGARVTVHRPGGKLTRTLTAGDGFLSQQGKTLHFGLGREALVEMVTVRWPGGGVDRFTGVSADGVWHLSQGGGVKFVPAAKMALPDSTPQVPEPTESLRLRLSQPLKLPPLKFTDFSGRELTVQSLTEQSPVLINLWATGCAPCAKELPEFAKLRDVTVLALCVDGLDESVKTTESEAAAFLSKAGHKGLSGWAGQELVAVLDRMIREAVYRHLRMPVPASFLVDRGGWLTVIYKGPVTRDVVQGDAGQLGVDEAAALRAALPFPGEWAGRKVFVSHPVAVAQTWRESGCLPEARTVLQRFLDTHPDKPSDAALSSRRAQVHFQLGDLELESGQPAKALEQFSAATAANPGLLPARVGRLRALADLDRTAELDAEVALLSKTAAGPDALVVRAEHAARAGRWAEAVADLRAAVAADPRFVPGLHQLAWLLATVPDDTVRNGAEALRTAEFFIQAPGARDNAEFLLTLAAAQAETGDFPGAAAIAEESLAIARSRADANFLRRAIPAAKAFREGRAWRLVSVGQQEQSSPQTGGRRP